MNPWRNSSAFSVSPYFNDLPGIRRIGHNRSSRLPPSEIPAIQKKSQSDRRSRTGAGLIRGRAFTISQLARQSRNETQVRHAANFEI